MCSQNAGNAIFGIQISKFFRAFGTSLPPNIWARLENKGHAIGGGSKKVQYLVFITHRPPPPIINDRSLSALFEPAINDMQGDSAAAAAISDYRHNTARLKKRYGNSTGCRAS